MSWRPGDVSPDARRAAEAAADAAGVPLEEWFVEAVRAAIIRELGHVPDDDPAPEPPAERQEPLELTTPETEPVRSLSARDAEPEHLRTPSVAAPEPVAVTAPPEPEPDLSEPVAVAEPPAPGPIAEPEPFPPAAVAEPPPVTPTTGMRAPAPAKEADAAAMRRSVSLEPRRLADSGFSNWLAGRIQGLPARTDPPTPNPIKEAQPAATPAPSPPAPALSKPRLDPMPPAPVPAPPVPQPPQPRAAGVVQAVLPLSLPTGPVEALRLASVQAASVRARRSDEGDAAISALAASVTAQGVREPILVRRIVSGANHYEVVAGERRRAAADRAGRADLPAVIVEANDAEALMLSLAENLGRGDFSPLDEARAYLRLLTEYRVNANALAQRLARERSHIALVLRLLGLPPTVRQLIDSGRLAPGQAFALLGAPDPETLAGQMIQAAASDPARSSG